MKHEGDIKAELEKLPKTLSDSYQVIYERILNAGETSRKIADRALKWLLCSKRRLSPSELIAAVTINTSGEYIPLNQRELLDTCCNLLVLDEELRTFRFAHLSVREFLEQLENFNDIEVNLLVLQRCLNVWTFEGQDHSTLATQQDNILKSYASFYWPFHCQNLGSQPKDKIKDRIKKFLVTNSNLAPSFETWLQDAELVSRSEDWLYPHLDYDRLKESFSSPPSLLFFTCCFGLTWLMHDLNQLKHISWNQCNDYGNPGLGIAIKWGYQEIVQLLLERDEVDVNFTNRFGQTALFLAADKGHEAMILSLLKRKDLIADIAADHHYTPLSIAARRGHEAAVRLLLRREYIAVNYADEKGWTPLAWAVFKGHEGVVRLLLERVDVNVNPMDTFGKTPLALAIYRKHEAVVRLLLERYDINVNSEDYFGDSPLIRAVRDGLEAAVHLLLERNDIHLNLRDSVGMTPLMLAITQGHKTMVRLLLERDDVEVDRKDHRGFTPRDQAERRGYSEIVRLLDSKKEKQRKELT